MASNPFKVNGIMKNTAQLHTKILEIGGWELEIYLEWPYLHV